MFCFDDAIHCNRLKCSAGELATYCEDDSFKKLMKQSQSIRSLAKPERAAYKDHTYPP
jgi:hypothetical protein